MENLSKETILQLIKQHKNELEKEYGIKELGLFGSYANGIPNDESDIDILIDFIESDHNQMSLFDFLDIKDKLEAILHHKVDLVMKSALKKAIKNRILQEVVYV